jgi:hypothetical protein
LESPSKRHTMWGFTPIKLLPDFLQHKHDVLATSKRMKMVICERTLLRRIVGDFQFFAVRFIAYFIPTETSTSRRFSSTSRKTQRVLARFPP